MFIPFFLELKAARIPVSLREYLTVLKGMEVDLVTYDIEGFYFLARSAMVKDERHIDRFEKLMEMLEKRLQEQKGRHQGGSKWTGTAATSPFGAYGYNPECVRIGQHESRHRRAVKVLDRREFRNFDDSVEFGTRNIKVALKRLRR